MRTSSAGRIAALAQCLALLLCHAVGPASTTGLQCEPLRSSTGGAETLCRRFYNSTVLLGSEAQRRSIASELNRFAGIITSPCHPQMALFVCASFFPVCTVTVNTNTTTTSSTASNTSNSSSSGGGATSSALALSPCSTFCSEVERSCLSLFLANRFTWPSQFNCSDRARYPRQDDDDAAAARRCLALPSMTAAATPPSPPSTVRPSANVTATGRARPCEGSYYFRAENRSFITWWITIWSILCLLSSLVTVATFFMDRERFNYPEKPIVFLSASYSVFSLTFIVRLAAGSTALVCVGDELVDAGVNSGPCTIVALLLYFAWMASYSWWLVLTLTWLLAAGFKWGTEAIARHSTHFHVLAWGAPAVQTLVLVATESVDADELARVCSVGNLSRPALLGFVLAPIAAYLAVGTAFIVVGIASLVRIRTLMKSGGRSTQKLERLIVRIGILSVFYTGPASVVLGIHAYEYAERDRWQSYCTDAAVCRPACVGDGCGRPLFGVYVVKYFMLLVVGVTSSVWIWSGKTVASWKRFSRRLFRKSERGAVDLECTRRQSSHHLSMEGSYARNPMRNGSAVHKHKNAGSVGRGGGGGGGSQAPVHSVTQV